MQSDIQTDRHKYSQIVRQTDIKTVRSNQTDRHKDSQVVRQTERKKEKQTEILRDRHR